MSGTPHIEHGVDELCAPGARLYEYALRHGPIGAQEAAQTPCLVDSGLLQPTVEDISLLEPVAPATALHRLLRSSAERVAEERRRELALAETFEAWMRIGGRRTAETEQPLIKVISGKRRINDVLTEAMAEAEREVLSIQPHTSYGSRTNPATHLTAMARDQGLLDRGGRIRTLYPHTLRHSPQVTARYEDLVGDVEARTLDEVTDRLICVDRTVAFIPASADATHALEIRHPALISYFATTFDRLWHLATPMYPEAVQQPTLNGITPRQRAIARLLVEGHTDTVIADRLGMNVRTARVHIAKLAATLGSESRAQLGYLIGQSGILGQERQED
ncbi:helix-turn-helix transcriptional regulator [Streptomyces sp. P17]|uniref:helix-turn-helix transcriptional regulator n=1 Tax=Streptomyces sp. P17 TaxID=3074716 RepID=UPI0028F43002|nr:helix-turn-helix transcriptional regulator [Streptomyces sp. P17]MDT9699653.1 helix-turn-helix transcriptional regulator [Streptomyces sp. P17]